jgi:hypothetical protein
MLLRRYLYLLVALGLPMYLTSCGTSSKSAATSQFVGAVSAIDNSISVAGASMATGAKSITRITSSDCYPATGLQSPGYPKVNSQDEHYPGHLTYCFLTVDAGDTVRGGFSIPKALTCLANSLSVSFDGNAHDFTVTPEMATACQLPSRDLGLRDGMAITITGSAPASFNPNYAQGIVLNVASMGLVFKMAINSSGSVNSFITNENWTDGSIGATAGKIDSSTGDLWYESRVERNNCSTSGRCGWNRHTRIRANLAMSGTTPTDLKSLSFAYSNIQFTPGQSNLGGTLITAKGDLSSGIKARLFNWDSSGSPSPTSNDYSDASRWGEAPNTKCYTSITDSASTCRESIDKPSATNTKFFLNGNDSHTSVADWFTSITGQTFSAIEMKTDNQF